MLIDLFNGGCCYCGCKLGVISKNDFEIDHICSKKPKNNSIENLAPACSMCNSMKSNMCNSTNSANIINPYNNIFNVFYRDSDF